MKWEDAFEARPSKNVRGEDVYDVYRKSTLVMIYSDIPVDSLEAIKKQMMDLLEHVAREELEEMLTGEKKESDMNPMSVEYDRLKDYNIDNYFIEEEDGEQ